MPDTAEDARGIQGKKTCGSWSLVLWKETINNHKWMQNSTALCAMQKIFQVLQESVIKGCEKRGQESKCPQPTPQELTRKQPRGGRKGRQFNKFEGRPWQLGREMRLDGLMTLGHQSRKSALTLTAVGSH